VVEKVKGDGHRIDGRSFSHDCQSGMAFTSHFSDHTHQLFLMLPASLFSLLGNGRQRHSLAYIDKPKTFAQDNKLGLHTSSSEF
jgi:hypothetical protein